MSFWSDDITGKPEDAFTKDIGEVIPNNTKAPAEIRLIELVEKENKYLGGIEKYFEITWKLVSGDFKGREVSQKIKCFNGELVQVTRARNMLKLIMNLCQYKPSHNNEPTVYELTIMNRKVLGIKIREWQIEKNDGSGFMEGNFVSEVHAINDSFVTETGIKLKQKNASYQKPLNHATESTSMHDDQDIPF